MKAQRVSAPPSLTAGRQRVKTTLGKTSVANQPATGGSPPNFRWISLGGGSWAAYHSSVMTRSSIEFAVQIFLVSLVVTFGWAFYKLMVQIGVW